MPAHIPSKSRSVIRTRSKEVRRDYEGRNPLSSADATRASTRNSTSRSVTQHRSIKCTSIPDSVKYTVSRTNKRAAHEKRSLEDVEEYSGRPKRARKLSVEVTDTSSDEDLSGLDTISLKRLRGPRTMVTNAPIDCISLSSSDEESSPDENMPMQHIHRTQASVHQASTDVASLLFGDCTTSKSSIADCGKPSLSPSAVHDIREDIRCAIRHIRKDDSAREKSAAQMNVLVAIMTACTDLVITMRTGGGKSMSWMVPSVMDEDARSIVVCPFVALLDQQYRTTAATGLRCHNYCVSKDIPENAQILFAQVEHCSSHAFSR